MTAVRCEALSAMGRMSSSRPEICTGFISMAVKVCSCVRFRAHVGALEIGSCLPSFMTQQAYKGIQEKKKITLTHTHTWHMNLIILQCWDQLDECLEWWPAPEATPEPWQTSPFIRLRFFVVVEAFRTLFFTLHPNRFKSSLAITFHITSLSLFPDIFQLAARVTS